MYLNTLRPGRLSYICPRDVEVITENALRPLVIVAPLSIQMGFVIVGKVFVVFVCVVCGVCDYKTSAERVQKKKPPESHPD